MSIVVPVFNEAGTVAAVIERLLSIDVPAQREIIVVNDGSTDGTGHGIGARAAERSGHRGARRSQPRDMRCVKDSRRHADR